MSLLTGKAFKNMVRYMAILYVFLVVASLFLWEIEEKVLAKGTVESKQQLVMHSFCDKTVVEEILKNAGDSVKEGEAVMRFADIKNLQHQIKEIQMKLTEMRSSFKRKSKLHKAKLLPDAEYEKLDMKLKVAENSLDRLDDEYSKLTIKAPFEGKVINYKVKLQEPVNIGTELFTIIGKGDKIIRCMAPQSLIFGLKKGDRVNIKSTLKNYLKYRIYHGDLVNIAPHGVEREDGLFFELIVGITDGQDELPVGSTALCEIIKGKELLWFSLIKGKTGK